MCLLLSRSNVGMWLTTSCHSPMLSVGIDHFSYFSWTLILSFCLFAPINCCTCLSLIFLSNFNTILFIFCLCRSVCGFRHMQGRRCLRSLTGLWMPGSWSYWCEVQNWAVELRQGRTSSDRAARATCVRCGTELWSSARAARAPQGLHVLSHLSRPSFIRCWPPQIFRLPLSLLKRTRSALQVAVWYDQHLEFYLRVDDHCFLGRPDVRPVCLPAVSWGKSLHGHVENAQGILARDDALTGPRLAWLVLLLISLASGWKRVY